MGTIEFKTDTKQIIIQSHLFLYGESISSLLATRMEEEINTLWNAPKTLIWVHNIPFQVEFNSKVFLFPDLQPHDIYSNRNTRNNYFRIEECTPGNISFTDGIGCNTGYFKAEHLYAGSTTAAHEYGHTLGLSHPDDLDIRGKGYPGIMYPRGTLVDPEFQYDPFAEPGTPGGTLHPKHRKVFMHDIFAMGIDEQILKKKFVLGKLSARYHAPLKDPLTS